MAVPEKIQLAPSVARRATLARRESSQRAEKLTRTAGVFKDYLQGLDNVRNLVRELESDFAAVLREFYGGDGEAAANSRLRAISGALDALNSLVERSGGERVLVNGQAALAKILNAAHGCGETGEEARTVASFWEGSREAELGAAKVVARFQAAVLLPLRRGCGSYKDSASLTAPDAYAREVAEYLARLESISADSRLLIASAGNQLNLQLVGKSSLLDRLLRGCDDESYPLLQLLPDLTAKMETLFATTRRWLDRDETYVFEIGDAIRETKSETKKKEEEMKMEKEKQRDLIKAVKSAFLICQNSKRKLREIADEVSRLEKLLTECSSEQRFIGEEKEKKENMAEFLEISITQTRRNYNLQLRRQKLVRQVQELEGALNEVHEQIADLKSEINSKSSAKEMVEEKHSNEERSYSNLKVDLESFTKNVCQINSEITSLRSSISELERIQIFKTSPERVDDFFERPRSVKLAPSLQEKISKRRNLKS